MYRNTSLPILFCLLALMLIPKQVDAQEPIRGPWLWMIAPTEQNQGGYYSTNVDSLAVASNGAVTETDVATNGANAGDIVGNYAWTWGTLNETGDINQLVNDIGMKSGQIDDYTSYALMVIESQSTQSNITMGVNSDDSIKVWLNGAVVHTNATNRGRGLPPPYQDTFQVNFNQGSNLLMVKVSERGGDWGMYVGINADFTEDIESEEPPPEVIDTPETDLQHIYWVNHNANVVQRSNLNGSDVQVLTQGDGRPVGIVVDVDSGKVYWSDRTRISPSDPSGISRIYRMNLDGTEKEIIVQSGNSVIEYLALDYFSGKIYWGEWSHFDADEKIRRANLDGTNIEDVITGITNPRGIALDNVGRRLYWVQHLQSDSIIQSANLDGSDRQDAFTAGGAHGIALDMADRKIYWTDWFNGKVQRADLDGSNVEELVSGLRFPAGIGLDLQSGKMYWAEAGAGRIQRANLDGSNVEQVVTRLASIIGLTLSVPPTENLNVPVYVDYSVSLSPATIESPTTGEEITFSLNITESTKIAGFQATIQFDATALRYVSSTTGGFLLSDSYTVTPVVTDNTVTIAASSLTGENSGDGTLATITFEVVSHKESTLTLKEVLLTESDGQVKIPYVEGVQITRSQFVREDVNRDGVVDILDLMLVAADLTKQGEFNTDVNEDGAVNIGDLVLVAGAIGSSPAAAPLLSHANVSKLTMTQVEIWLKQAKQLHITETQSFRGIYFLQQLLSAMTPEKTALLANYPNPFNPETWIPYQLAKPADVTLFIYATDGNLIRTLSLGQKSVGNYHSQSRAAYWDGKNDIGETVASGIYYYSLTAGDFKATRKMLILK